MARNATVCSEYFLVNQYFPESVSDYKGINHLEEQIIDIIPKHSVEDFAFLNCYCDHWCSENVLKTPKSFLPEPLTYGQAFVLWLYGLLINIPKIEQK